MVQKICNAILGGSVDIMIYQ